MNKIKFYIFILSVICVISAIGLAWIINSLHPSQSGPVILFYTVLLVFGFSLLTLLGFYIRRFAGQREWQGYYLSVSARQGLWLSMIFALCLFLLSKNWFNWFNGILLVLIFTSFEAYLFAKKNNN